jgi:hypothetical protein
MQFRSPEGRVALVIDVEKVRYTQLPFELHASEINAALGSESLAPR